ncbi:DUF742 domain-containing protein [Streptomyces sp. H27-D2]|uniref:DUF742 domain-containing protein n=1 Tax=Streptomyces sp. H27-D2 TaxID=3046304 RepID=UPI002DC02774|nr:DUF742 domain-containing protein [Streptomyces sp. H27-D2]MEC4019783.1 DUF742 domain-containing protein [Streptomyces sp. H27-D2]
MTPRRREKGLVRPYVVTSGRARPTRNTLDLVTLVYATSPTPTTAAPGSPDSTGPGAGPEARRILALCRGGSLSLAEVAAHLSLPVSITKVLIADLVDHGHLATRAPIPPAQRFDPQLLEEVLRGLRAIK